MLCVLHREIVTAPCFIFVSFVLFPHSYVRVGGCPRHSSVPMFTPNQKGKKRMARRRWRGRVCGTRRATQNPGGGSNLEYSRGGRKAAAVSETQ